MTSPSSVYCDMMVSFHDRLNDAYMKLGEKYPLVLTNKCHVAYSKHSHSLVESETGETYLNWTYPVVESVADTKLRFSSGCIWGKDSLN